MPMNKLSEEEKMAIAHFALHGAYNRVCQMYTKDRDDADALSKGQWLAAIVEVRALFEGEPERGRELVKQFAELVSSVNNMAEREWAESEGDVDDADG